MAKAKNIIEYPNVITIVGAIKPVEIVKKVVNTFIVSNSKSRNFTKSSQMAIYYGRYSLLAL